VGVDTEVGDDSDRQGERSEAQEKDADDVLPCLVAVLGRSGDCCSGIRVAISPGESDVEGSDYGCFVGRIAFLLGDVAVADFGG